MCRYRIEFVIVAASALQGMCQERFADAISNVVKKSLPSDFGNFHSGQFPGAHAQKARCDNRVRIVRIHFITRDLLSDELVIGLVLVEGTNHVVSIPPRVTTFKVVGKTRTVCITSHIQPMLRHSLTVVR